MALAGVVPLALLPGSGLRLGFPVWLKPSAMALTDPTKPKPAALLPNAVSTSSPVFLAMTPDFPTTRNAAPALPRVAAETSIP